MYLSSAVASSKLANVAVGIVDVNSDSIACVSEVNLANVVGTE
jgi:hypothetical protein